ncbi:hypothetical protein ASR50_02385 [Streptomyces sp. 4F]|nr:hypothetical protein ASR50_02385 [Streptomyces sp. 4F]
MTDCHSSSCRPRRRSVSWGAAGAPGAASGCKVAHLPGPGDAADRRLCPSEAKTDIDILDNGSGKTCRRADQQKYTLWCYSMDVASFGTMDFPHGKWYCLYG